MLSNMRKRTLFPFIFLFIPSYIYGNDCTGKNETDCKNARGCQYYDLFGTPYCGLCKEGKYCPDVNDNNKCSDWNDNGGVCTCPEPFTESDAGATEMEDCYKNVSCKYYSTSAPCKDYYHSSIECTISGTKYYAHNEQNSENGTTCYLNWLDCNQFNVNGSNCSAGDQSREITGQATYNSSTHKWDISTCECETDYPSDTCSAKQTYSITNSNGHVDLVIDGIGFDWSRGYWCTQCKPGYYVNHETDIDTESHEIDNCKADHVCQCTQIPKGKYQATECQPFSYLLANTNHDICPPTNCPAGKTTDSAGTVGNESNVCKYSPTGTKFCDANGCFNLDISNWNFGTTNQSGL